MYFNAINFIERKRDRKEHSEIELRAFVDAVCKGDIDDAQISAWLMAVYFNELTDAELMYLTDALSKSGDTFEIPDEYTSVDKHSTGGVGDKTTLIVAPLVAACGQKVAKLSGRGLGFTGGTVDKLESIPGMKMRLSADEFLSDLRNNGIAISATSRTIAPAEGKLYAIRDVTGTVPSIPLIASSVVSKKVAGGADAFVFDVKCGSGAFMHDISRAESLASMLVSLSASLGKRSAAVITNMDQPLGEWSGNAAEVIEAIDVLSGVGPSDTRELSILLAAEMLVLGGSASDIDSAEKLAVQKLDSGEALKKFEELVVSHGGDRSVIRDPRGVLTLAPNVLDIRAQRAGAISSMDVQGIGEAIKLLGGGRNRKDDAIDASVAFRSIKKIGAKVDSGEVIAQMHYSDDRNLSAARGILESAFVISDDAPPPRLVLKRVYAH